MSVRWDSNTSVWWVAKQIVWSGGSGVSPSGGSLRSVGQTSSASPRACSPHDALQLRAASALLKTTSLWYDCPPRRATSCPSSVVQRARAAAAVCRGSTKGAAGPALQNQRPGIPAVSQSLEHYIPSTRATHKCRSTRHPHTVNLGGVRGPARSVTSLHANTSAVRSGQTNLGDPPAHIPSIGTEPGSQRQVSSLPSAREKLHCLPQVDSPPWRLLT
jgi:hypothetical protein